MERNEDANQQTKPIVRLGASTWRWKTLDMLHGPGEGNQHSSCFSCTIFREPHDAMTPRWRGAWMRTQGQNPRRHWARMETMAPLLHALMHLMQLEQRLRAVFKHNVVTWGLAWIWLIYIFPYYLAIDRCGYDDGNTHWSVTNESKIHCISTEWKKLPMNNDTKRENNWLDRESKLVSVIVHLSKSRKVKWKVNNTKYTAFVGHIFFITSENLMIVSFVMIL